MASLTFKSISPRIHRELRAQAARHNRSMTKEAIALIEQGLKLHRPVDVDAMLKRARALRAQMKFVATPEDIDRFKREGRE
jgi:plasmid stability protein